MKFASFDLESAEALPNEVPYNTDCFRNLGIVCAAVALVDSDKCMQWNLTEDIIFWKSETTERLTKEDCQEIVRDLLLLVDEGYTFITWNGTNFDFRLLAVQSEMYTECALLAYRHHVDMMLYVVFYKGHYLSLQKALEGIGNIGKLHDVALNDGTILTDMEGGKAPYLWRCGEFDAVLTYLNYDVTEPLAVLQFMYKKHRIQWFSKTGNPQVLLITEIKTVKNLLYDSNDHPDWGKYQITRTQFIDWMPVLTFKD